MTFIFFIFNLLTLLEPDKPNKIDTLPVITSWHFTNNFFQEKISYPVDTNIQNFYNYNPASILIKSYIFNSNIGTPLLSNNFSERKYFNFFFLNYYYPYLFTKFNDFYINTRKPFSKITYINGGPSSAKEESIDVIHSQNINPFFNFGLNFYSGSSQGYLQWNKTKRNSFKLFFSYEKKKYSSFGTLRINKFSCFENGGITEDSLLFDENYLSQGDFPVIFSGQGTPPHDKANVINSFKNTSANFYQCFTIYKKGDSLNDINIKFINSFEINLNKRNFIDINPQTGIDKNLIEHLFFNEKNTNDSFSYNNFIFNYGLTLEKNKIKYFITGIGNYNHYFFHSTDQSRNSIVNPFYYTFNYFNNGIKTGLKLSNNNFILYSSLKYYFSGFEAKSYVYSSILEFKFLNTNTLINLEIKNNKPSFLYYKYFSNNYLWENNFDFEKQYLLSIIFTNPLVKIKFDNFLIKNYLFFNNKSIPEQYPDKIVVNILTIDNNLKIGKFLSNNYITLQKSSNKNILNIPVLLINHSLSFNFPIKFNFTGGLLETSTGYEIKYYSSFYAQKYSPYVSAYYQQNFKKIGDYPLINVFLQIKLKRLRFFLKYEHVNYKLIEKEYFSGIGYPLMERTFKYGLSWHFYD